MVAEFPIACLPHSNLYFKGTSAILFEVGNILLRAGPAKKRVYVRREKLLTLVEVIIWETFLLQVHFCCGKAV